MRRLPPFLAFLLLAACGQAGSLYLPDPKPDAAAEAEEVAPPVPEPEERKPDRPQEP